MSKTTYRVQNWKQYNRSLINRGNLTLWFCEEYAKSRQTGHLAARRSIATAAFSGWTGCEILLEEEQEEPNGPCRRFNRTQDNGEGEWKMRTHGKQKRGTWRKLHIAINPNGMETVAIELTEAGRHAPVLSAGIMQQRHKLNANPWIHELYKRNSRFQQEL